MITLQGISKTYRVRGSRISAVHHVDLELQPGDGVLVRGASGSGKSTLLHMLGAMLRPTSGTVTMDGVDPWAGSPRDRAALRRSSIGFVFQAGHLLPWLSLQANVEAAGVSSTRATELLTSVGLAHRVDHRPLDVSGGEQQRAAVARAMAASPSLVLADEPTGTLDSTSAAAVIDLLEQARADGATVVLATHDSAIDLSHWRTLTMDDGRMVEG